MQWVLDSERPVYIQLVEQIQAGIISGQYKPGDRLPSVRDLAAEATVNPNTMQRALAELERVGLVYANRTSGRFITPDEAMIGKLREQSAQQQAASFLEKLQQLGFGPRQALALLEQVIRDMEAAMGSEEENKT